MSGGRSENCRSRGALPIPVRQSDHDDALTLTDSAAKNRIMLAPGVVFRPLLQPSPWMRFNVTTCDNPRVLPWLEQVVAQRGNIAPRHAAE
jgi:hypothetical protein